MSATSPRALHDAAIVIDATAPLLSDPSYTGEWIQGGATVATPTIAVRDTPADTLVQLAKWHSWLHQAAERLVHVTTVADIRRAKGERKLGILFAFQDTTPIEWRLELLETYQSLGVRMIGLAYNFRNRVGDGCAEPSDAGLSKFGRSVVREMNRLGIVVDCSHTGYRTTMEAIELSTLPPVFSHSNPRKLVGNGRNIWDDQALAVAAKDGLVGLGGFPPFVSTKPNPTLDDWLDQLEYWVQLVGPDHVGLGLDYFRGESVTDESYQRLLRDQTWYLPDYPAPPYPYPRGIENATKLANITEGLARRRYGDVEILKILGQNWMRVFGANWGA
jgi:membrane dipeptidase